MTAETGSSSVILLWALSAKPVARGKVAPSMTTADDGMPESVVLMPCVIWMGVALCSSIARKSR
eukprot:1869917-Prymnesium_polylepis.1